MDFLYQMISVSEVILINLLLFSMNVKPKITWKLIILIFIIYTLILIPIGVVVIKVLGIYGNGNALFTMFGFFYLFPIHYAFEGTTNDIFILFVFAGCIHCW